MGTKIYAKYLGAQVNIIATNAASLVEKYNKQMDYAMNHAEHSPHINEAIAYRNLDRNNYFNM